MPAQAAHASPTRADTTNGALGTAVLAPKWGGLWRRKKSKSSSRACPRATSGCTQRAGKVSPLTVPSAELDHDHACEPLDYGSDSGTSTSSTCSSDSYDGSRSSRGTRKVDAIHANDNDDYDDDDDESWRDAWSAMLYRNEAPRKRVVIVD